MAGGAAEVEAVEVAPVVSGSGEGAVVAGLASGECSDEQVAVVHVGEGAFGVEGAAPEGMGDGSGEVGGVGGPGLEHGFGMAFSEVVPVGAVGELFTHEGGVFAGGGLGGVELRRAASPHDVKGERPGFVVADDVVELVYMVEAEDDHEGVVEARVFVLRGFVEVEVGAEQRGDAVVLEVLGFVPPLGRDGVFGEEVEEGLLGVEAGSDEMLGAVGFAITCADSYSPSAFHKDFLQFHAEAEVAVACLDEGFRELGRTAPAELCHAWAGEQGGDVVAETFAAQVHFPEAVEEEEAGLDGGVLELALDELQGGQGAGFEEELAVRGLGEALFAFFRGKGRGLGFRDEEVLDDGQEAVTPLAKGVGIPAVEGGHGGGGLFKVGPPGQSAAVPQCHGHVVFGFVVGCPESGEPQLLVPQHFVEGAVVERVGVVEVS